VLRLGLAGLIFVAGCVEFASTTCADGRTCAEGRVCDDVHQACVSPEQLETCRDEADGADCIADSTFGVCDAEVCILAVCGDGDVGRAEECDGATQQSCISYGYNFGPVDCSAECNLDLASSCHRVGFERIIAPFFSGDVTGVWGSETGDIFVSFSDLEGGGALYRYRGETWESTSVAEPMKRVWGRSNSDVFAVGDSGAIYHYDGTQWSKTADGITDKPLRYVIGDSDNVYALGDNVALHFDGSAWTEDSPPGAEFTSAAIVSGVLYAAGDTNLDPDARAYDLLRREGTAWVALGENLRLNDLVTSGDSIYGVGSAGRFVEGTGDPNSLTWTTLTPIHTEKNFLRVWAAANGSLFAISGEFPFGSKRLWHRLDGVWKELVGVDRSMESIGGSGNRPIVSTVGSLQRAHKTVRAVSAAWFFLPQSAWVHDRSFLAVADPVIVGSTPYAIAPVTVALWGRSPTELYAASNDNGEGKLFLFDGNDWFDQGLPAPAEPLKTMWGDDAAVWVGGLNGAVHEYRAGQWQNVSISTTRTVSSIWGRDASLFALVDGEQEEDPDTIMALVDGVWTEQLTASVINGLWGASETAVFAVGLAPPRTTSLPSIAMATSATGTGLRGRSRVFVRV
jgi:hypothetical protein